ncbi:MAG TPA: ribose-phosphate diphosphokinase [Nannocystis sp.]
MKLFALAASADLGRELVAAGGGLVSARCELDRFAGGELYAELQTTVGGEDCAVLGTLAPPERNLAEFLLVCDTLRRHGARSVVAVLPYFAYARQDKFEAGRSLAAAWVGALLQASGVTRVVTLDVHSPRVAELCPIALTSVDSAPLFVGVLGAHLDPDTTIVAPDEGALARCRRLRDLLRPTPSLAHFKKVRSRTGVSSSLVGSVRPRAIVFDDILDTGDTLVACAEGLQAAGARHLVIVVTHGLFTGTDWQRLWSLGVERIVVTDSVGRQPTPDRRVEVVSCAPALASALQQAAEVQRAHA